MSDADCSASKKSPREIALRVAKIVATVFLYLFVGLCIFAVVILLMGKGNEDGATTVFGYQLRTVLTSSMDENEKTDTSDFDIGSIPKDAMVFIETVPEDPNEAKAFYNGIKEGDVLTFMYDEYDIGGAPEVITHRVIGKRQIEGGWEFTLRGDNNSDAEQKITSVGDPKEPFNYVIGKVVGTSNLLGYFVTFIKKPVGMIFLVIVPCFIIILFEVLRIVRTLGEQKRAKLGEEKKQKDDKIAELERQLEEMKREKRGGDK